MSDWHLDKKLNVGHIMATIVIAASLFTYINKLENKTNENAFNIKSIKEQRKEDIARAEKQRKEDTQRVEKALDKINIKLDKLLSK